MKFYERLKELREEKDLTQKALADKLKVNFRTISTWENGTRKPDIDMLIKIAKYFGVHTDYLLGLED